MQGGVVPATAQQAPGAKEGEVCRGAGGASQASSQHKASAPPQAGWASAGGEVQGGPWRPRHHSHAGAAQQAQAATGRREGSAAASCDAHRGGSVHLEDSPAAAAAGASCCEHQASARGLQGEGARRAGCGRVGAIEGEEVSGAQHHCAGIPHQAGEGREGHCALAAGAIQAARGEQGGAGSAIEGGHGPHCPCSTHQVPAAAVQGHCSLPAHCGSCRGVEGQPSCACQVGWASWRSEQQPWGAAGLQAQGAASCDGSRGWRGCQQAGAAMQGEGGQGRCHQQVASAGGCSGRGDQGQRAAAAALHLHPWRPSRQQGQPPPHCTQQGIPSGCHQGQAGASIHAHAVPSAGCQGPSVSGQAHWAPSAHSHNAASASAGLQGGGGPQGQQGAAIQHGRGSPAQAQVAASSHTHIPATDQLQGVGAIDGGVLPSIAQQLAACAEANGLVAHQGHCGPRLQGNGSGAGCDAPTAPWRGQVDGLGGIQGGGEGGGGEGEAAAASRHIQPPSARVQGEVLGGCEGGGGQGGAEGEGAAGCCHAHPPWPSGSQGNAAASCHSGIPLRAAQAEAGHASQGCCAIGGEGEGVLPHCTQHAGAIHTEQASA